MSFTINTSKYKSGNYDDRPSQGGAITALVIHTTEGNWDSDAKWLCNPTSGVSTHYVVPPTGNVAFRLVEEAKRAWHAGESYYHGRSDWNDFSIGVEISHLEGQVWSAGQRTLLTELCKDLVQRHNIAESNVVAHRWVATPEGRKRDPTDWPDDQFRAWIHSLYAPLTYTLPGLTSEMACGQGFHDFYYAHGGIGMWGYALTPEAKDIDSLGRECTWMRFERAVYKYVYGEGVHLALLVEAVAKKWLI
jgi:hypothetical protein